MVPGDRVMSSAAMARLTAAVRRSPACMAASAAALEEPQGVVARQPAPRHRPSQMEVRRRFLGPGRQDGGLLEPALGLARQPPGEGQAGQSHGELVGARPAATRAGRRPSQRSPQIVGDVVELRPTSAAFVNRLAVATHQPRW